MIEDGSTPAAVAASTCASSSPLTSATTSRYALPWPYSPVVAANAMALPHLVHDGENGHLFEPGNVDDYRDAHRQMDEVLAGSGDLAERVRAHRAADEIPPERLQECVDAFSSALRGLIYQRSLDGLHHVRQGF